MISYNYINLTTCLILMHSINCFGQLFQLSGYIKHGETPVPYAGIFFDKTSIASVSNADGFYVLKNIPEGEYKLIVTCLGFKKTEQKIVVTDSETLDITLVQDEKKLQEVVITGVSKATRIKENPLAVSSIGLKSIEQSSENNIMDIIQKKSSGVSMLKSGPNISKPFIRGLGYNRVLTLYDGIRQEGQQWGDEHGIEIDAYGMQNIEVIKGPASLMYGSDAVAGVVSFIPQVPDTSIKKLHGKIVNEYQHNNNLTGTGAYLFQNTKRMSFGLSGSHRLAKNYRNKVDGRVYNTGFQEINLSGKLMIYLKKSLLNLNVTVYDNVQGIPDGSRDSLTRQFTFQQFEGTMDDIKNRPIVSNSKLSGYKHADLHQQIKHYRLYAKQSIDIKKSKLSYLLALQHNIRKEITHPTDLNQAGLFVNLSTANYHFMYQLPETKNSVTAIGFNGMLQRNLNKDATDFPIPNYNLYDAGVFFHHSYKFKKLCFSGGLRYDFRKAMIQDLYTSLNKETGFIEETDGTLTPESYHQYKAFERNFDGLSGSAGLSYILNEIWNLKINFSRGYRAPGVTELSSNGLDPGARIVYLGNKNFEPEFSNQQDLGVFVAYENFEANLSVFNNFMQNYIYLAQLADANNNPITDAQGNKTFQYQQSKAQLYGFETGISLHPLNWKGFEWSHHFQMLYGINKQKLFEGKGIYGAYLPFIPPANYSTQCSKKIYLNSGKISFLSPKLEFEYHAAQSRFMALYGTETYTASYYLINTSFHIEFKESRKNQWSLYCFLNNITNTIYQSNMSRLKYFEYYKDTRPNTNGIYNMGRNIGAKLIFKF